ncbi:hypothetical protein BST61_g7165 [Cercospora zeina]
MSSQRRLALANLRVSTASLPSPKSAASPSSAESLWRRYQRFSGNTPEASGEVHSPANSEHLVQSAIAPPTRGTFLSAIDEVAQENIGSSMQGVEEANPRPSTAFATVEDNSRYQKRPHTLEALTRGEEEHSESVEANSRPRTAMSATEHNPLATIAFRLHHRLDTLRSLTTRRRSTATSAPGSASPTSSLTTSKWSLNSPNSVASAATPSNNSHTIKMKDSRFRVRSPGGALNSSPLTTLEKRANQKAKRQNRKDGALHHAPYSPLSPLFRPSGMLQPAPLSPVFNASRVEMVSCMSSGVSQAIEQMHETKCKKGQDWVQLGF